MEAIEYCETSSITLEWTVRGLKNLFDSSKGDVKSKVTKSIRFGGGRWQVLFYPNSGHEGGFISLYLSCEPTEDEKERAVDGKWVREGLFKFSFELRNVNRGHLSPQKEACDHAFSWKTSNWGYSAFAKRDAAFYGSNIVRHHDAFLIIVRITGSPSIPSPTAPIAIKSVPRSLLDSVGGMLDDPVYSDVRFVLPARRRSDGRCHPSRTIYAAKRILQRIEYFDTMFSSGFAEAATSPIMSYPHTSLGANNPSDSISLSVVNDQEHADLSEYDGSAFDDSDQSDEDSDAEGDSVSSESLEKLANSVPEVHVSQPEVGDAPDEDVSGTTSSSTPTADVPQQPRIFDLPPPSYHTAAANQRDSIVSFASDTTAFARQDSTESLVIVPADQIAGAEAEIGSNDVSDRASTPRAAGEDEDGAPHGRTLAGGVYDEPLRFGSGRHLTSQTPNIMQSPGVKPSTLQGHGQSEEVPGPRKTTVVVKECEYATYFAVLYYLYTDLIVFCPLTSDFLTRSNHSASSSSSASPVAGMGTSSGMNRNSPPQNPSLVMSASGLVPAHPGSSSASAFYAAQQPPPSHSHQRQASASYEKGYAVAADRGEKGEAVHRSRREWVAAWRYANPGRPAPCSAKACYRLADKLGLTELRARAFQHIVKSLTVANVPYEVFSSFSAAFEEVRKVQVEFFLANWTEIKSSDAMRNVFQQIRLGRHPGFEEVWPLIIVNLEFNPRPQNVVLEGPQEVILA